MGCILSKHAYVKNPKPQKPVKKKKLSLLEDYYRRFSIPPRNFFDGFRINVRFGD